MDLGCDIWSDDRLDFARFGRTFTNLIKSLDESRTISIEAGFGRGKTFFRQRWHRQLEQDGELVVSIDATGSSVSDDPVALLIAELLTLIPKEDKSRLARAKKHARKWGGVVLKSTARATLREGIEEISDALHDENATLASEIAQSVAKDSETHLSKAAGALIDAQLQRSESQQGLFQQLDALHQVLTEGHGTKRIVVIVDELDRCHPDYSLELLEAMKTVFNHPGFVFVLMVNPDYLSQLAAHRFGPAVDGEPYIEKFVDFRLNLPTSQKNMEIGAELLAEALPKPKPFGSGAAFDVPRAARLAGELAVASGISMRKIKRTIARVELTLRCYPERKIDLSLLVFLAFREAAGKTGGDKPEWVIPVTYLPRAGATPRWGQELKGLLFRGVGEEERARTAMAIYDSARELESCLEPPSGTHDSTPALLRVIDEVVPRYVPDHEEMLAAILTSDVVQEAER